MRILLINPPQSTRYPQPPLGLASIAAILEKHSYHVEILDANALALSESEAAERAGGADIVGITAMTPTINSAIRIAQEIKAAASDSLVILGGPHATILPTETLADIPQIDIIVRGEGEETIIELVNALSRGKDLSSVNGIAYRKNGVIETTPARPPISNLDALPFLAYHLLPMSQYRLHPPYGREAPFMAVITSRGCPYDCIYCSKPVFGTKFRTQTPKRIVDELSYLKQNFRVKEIKFYDDVFTLDKEGTIRLTEELNQRGLHIPWSCETRVNLVTEELLTMMRKAGCYMIAYGIESGNQAILDGLRKRTTIEQAEKAVKATRHAGIQTVGYFMLGSPGETPETIRQTIEFAKNSGLDFAQFSVTTPFPGTDLYELYSKQSPDRPDWNQFTYANLDSASTPVFETALLSRDDLQKWTGRAYKEFYLRLPYFWQRLTRIRSLGDVKSGLMGALTFLDMIRTPKKT